MPQYNYLIVGAGLFGATFAHEASRRGKSCIVIDKRPHVGGNIYTESVDGIIVHRYGAHVFHTNDANVWAYATRFAEFNNYVNAPLARYGDELYNLPFNMNTFNRLWGVRTPDEAKAIIERQRADAGISEPRNLEEQAISLAGRDIYEKLIKGYTEKQWGRDCKDLPASILRRLPLRYTYDNNYYNERYQGVPTGGYTQIVDRMLSGCGILLDTDYFAFTARNPGVAERTIYTGAIDEFFGYCYGELAYRSLRFETETLQTDNYQGAAVVNYTARDIPYTRIIEHKHFEFGTQPATIITREYPADWKRDMTPYYPINDEKNNALYTRYKALADERDDLFFGGRLGQYKYYDMGEVIAAALELAGQVV